MVKYGYKVKSNGNPESLGMNKTLEERLVAIGGWFAGSEVDAKNYLWCLEKAFEHWGWQPPESKAK